MNGYNFTERVRKVLARAREEAARLHHEYVGTEHILLGLIKLGEGVAVNVLGRMGLDLKTVNRVRKIVKDFADRGGAVLLISTDLDELVELSDRIAIISRGSFVGEVDNNSADTARQVGEFMVGSAHTEGNHV
jgi:ATP-dependent Clp protease ATP-binding subunit ClpA